MKSAEVMKLLKICFDANVDSLVVVDSSGKKVNPKRIAAAGTAKSPSIRPHVKNTGQEPSHVGTAERKGRKMASYKNSAMRKHQELLDILSQKYEDIEWMVNDNDKEVTEIVGEGFLLTGNLDGLYKSFVLLDKMSMKERIQWGSAIGNDLYEARRQDEVQED